LCPIWACCFFLFYFIFNTVIVIGGDSDIDDGFIVVCCYLFSKFFFIGNFLSVFLFCALEQSVLSLLLLFCIGSSIYSGERSMSEFGSFFYKIGD